MAGKGAVSIFPIDIVFLFIPNLSYPIIIKSQLKSKLVKKCNLKVNSGESFKISSTSL